MENARHSSSFSYMYSMQFHERLIAVIGMQKCLCSF